MNNPTKEHISFEILLIHVLDQIKELLLRKNKAYGDSALNPIRMFSKASPLEQIKVRIDDKLSRLQKGMETEAVPEDTIMDLIGYLVLYQIAVERQKRDTN